MLVRVAAFTGLRIGEVGALRIRDIDLRPGEIQVRLNRVETSEGLDNVSPKSRAGRRDVPILDHRLLRDLAVYLREHPHRDNLEADLWPGKTRGPSKINYACAFRPKGFTGSTFKKACDAAGLSGLHFHELRHTFATLALESGLLTMYELSVAMGHESEKVTNKTYAHLRKRDHTARRAAFSAFLQESDAPSAPIRSISGV
ncbi:MULTISPECIES: site-specific integrase [unclassified Microbacterium]|uniref:site-specific integrase n=1 Tax=unclassified Microbacterium TaxID=2609290 RepID=UPI003652B7F3